MLGRRHPNVTARLAGACQTAPVPPDPDQPTVPFRGVICIRCERKLDTVESLRLGLYAEHSARPDSS